MTRRLFLAVPAFADVFNGRTLDGWAPTGNAQWTVEDGCLVGRQGAGGAAGDLFTTARWTDFDAECEWRMKWPGNSGFWFRYSGPRTGYQADFIDQPSHPNVYSGSLYCMGKAFLAENHRPETVHRDGWNKLAITARGDHYVVRLNGATVADVRDKTFLTAGSLGLQVHAGAEFAGMEVRVRRLRVRSH